MASYTLRLALLTILAMPAWTQTPQAQRQNAITEPQIVPDQFLREYDPITIFLVKAQGPQEGGPVDLPVDWFSMTPHHPGTLKWLDAKTLQFFPTIPWSPLTNISLSVFDTSFQLISLVQPPTQLVPAPGSGQLSPTANISLSFPQPIEVATLAQMIRLQVSPLPGLSDQSSYWLTQRDFHLKAMERKSIRDVATYVLTLKRPLPDGQAVTLELRIAPNASLTNAVMRYRYQTQTPFRLSQVGIGKAVFPIASQGSTYQKTQILNGGSQPNPLFLEFSHPVADPGIELVKNLVGFEPAVKNFSYRVQGKRLILNFERQTDRSYFLKIRPAAVKDTLGRTLTMPNPSQLWFFYPSQPHFLAWDETPGILERYGAQELPMLGLGDQQVDLRIYPIDPLDMNFWPFSASWLGPVDETVRPPTPGEEPPAYQQMARHIRQLGSPPISKIVDLPLENRSEKVRFGLPIGAYLSQISGAKAPGTYLIGIRRLGASNLREYTRVQVTDLNLTTWESRNAISFAVTSLQTGTPIAGAKVKVEGRRNGEPVVIFEGVTNQNGLWTYQHQTANKAGIYRISVSHENDVLVLDPASAPAFFFDNHWYGSNGYWLDWLNRAPVAKPIDQQVRAHLYSERPIYRPEDRVHISGIVRAINQGTPQPAKQKKWQLAIYGPGGKYWTYPVQLDRWDSFHFEWKEKNLPTGRFDAALIDNRQQSISIGSLSFKKEAYKIPKFETHLHGPANARLDKAFDINLVADYYAGGRVVGAEVLWRISRRPITFKPPAWPGFSFSSDTRFTPTTNQNNVEPVTSKRDKTDENGSALLKLDPTQYPESGPTQYLVEAEVRGLDQQSVSTTKAVNVMPPFVLGLKVPRLIQETNTVTAHMTVLGPDGKTLSGQEFRVRLLKRQWHAYLRESDFTTGSVKYETDIVDEPISEETFQSANEALSKTYTLDSAGVYILELAARDHLGRLQKVQRDFLIAGSSPTGWDKSKNLVFDATWEKASYSPGETANLVLKSPFQKARALVAVESPEGLQYHWVEVTNGTGIFSLKVTAAMARQIPVHTLLMRGRVGNTQARNKPMALGNSQTLVVKPTGFQAKIELTHKTSHLPGSQMPLDISMTDPDGKPLNGKVTLWLVDRAVLALAREANLNPVDSFIKRHESSMRLRDTRNLVLGEIPLEEMPGGDGFEAKRQSLFGNVTVRRNFQTVPYYQATILVENGKAQATVPLPDNLTEFAIRAVGVSDKQRFGMAKSTVAIRLPVIVQSALPRFVRPGDQFQAGGIARLVEGEESSGRAEIKVSGLDLGGEASQTLSFEKGKPKKVFFPMTVTKQAGVDGAPEQTVRVSLAISRDSDGASDAFEIKLPILPDRQRMFRETLNPIAVGQTIPWEGLPEPAREGTLQRTVKITSRADIVTLLTGLGFNARYPYGCTEQRISQVFPEMILEPLLNELGISERSKANKAPLKELLTYLEEQQLANGLFGFWPGSNGQVSLTAYATQFLLAAQKAGNEVNQEMLNKAIGALKNAIRSDSPLLAQNYGLEERATAILVLVEAGHIETGYLDDLASLGRNMSLGGEANVLAALSKANRQGDDLSNRMAEDLRKSLNISGSGEAMRIRDLQYRSDSWGGALLSSEASTIANITKALYHYDAQAMEVPLLTKALLRLGKGDGWGDTRTNAAALLTLAELLNTENEALPVSSFDVSIAGTKQTLRTSEKAVVTMATPSTQKGSVSLVSADENAESLVWFQTSYLPETGGDQATAIQNGFSITRKLKLLGAEAKATPKSAQPQPGKSIAIDLGSVVEEQLSVVNPTDRAYVAISIPFAAGLEPLNPNLATAPSYATPSSQLTLPPTYVQLEDGVVHYFYDQLPKGRYNFYIRLQAITAGSFTQPPASAEMMYQQATRGNTAGCRIVIANPEP